MKNKGGRPPDPSPGSASIISNIIGKVRSPSAPGKVQCLRQKGKNSDAIKDAKGERARESKRAQSLVCHSPSKRSLQSLHTAEATLGCGCSGHRISQQSYESYIYSGIELELAWSN